MIRILRSFGSINKPVVYVIILSIVRLGISSILRTFCRSAVAFVRRDRLIYASMYINAFKYIGRD